MLAFLVAISTIYQFLFTPIATRMSPVPVRGEACLLFSGHVDYSSYYTLVEVHRRYYIVKMTQDDYPVQFQMFIKRP